MERAREHPDWLLAVASAVGVVVALPLLYLMAVQWLRLVELGGWGAYAIVAWGVGWTLYFAWHVFVPLLEDWHYERIGERVTRQSDTSARDS